MPALPPSIRDHWREIALGFIGAWLFISFCISQTGWSSFARRHRARTRPPGRTHRATNSWFRGPFSAYGNLISVVFGETGIHVRVVFLFRPFHPPFLVPWASVSRVEKKFGFFGQQYRVDIHDDAGQLHMIVPRSARDDLMAHYRKPAAEPR